MILLDSCGWIEIASDAGNAAWFEQALESRNPVLVPAVCIFEVYRHLERHSGRQVANKVIATMRQHKVLDIDTETALGAAVYSKEHGLAAMDALIYSVAQRNRAELWTQDSAFKDLPGVKYRPKKAVHP